MTDYICCEWGLKSDKQTDLVTAKDNDKITFPHIDSCMGILFILPGSVVIAGHAAVSTESGKFGFEDSLIEMLDRMLAAANKVTPITAAFIGASSGLGDVWPLNEVLLKTPALEGVRKQSVDSPESMDAFFDLGTYRLMVLPYQKDAGFPTTTEPKDAIYNGILHVSRKSSSGRLVIS